MEKLKLHSPDLTQANIEKLAQIFPNCVAEALDADGTLKRRIDFDQLRQELSRSIVEGTQERYQLNWPGKREALFTANAPIAKTLRPYRNESVDFDTTKNLFIEGDNLDALKLLLESYLNKVKMIYIDPPYNTGHDFIYNDDFSEDLASYLERSNQSDAQGNRMLTNSDANGRYHSDWMSMMYPRLKLARTLLKDNGIIFISIDDGEVGNLRKMCDEIFGSDNFLAQIVWQKIHSTKNDARYYSDSHEYLLCYAKNIQLSEIKLLARTAAMDARFTNPDNDPRGPWASGDLVANEERTGGYFEITGPTGNVFNVPKGKHWVYAETNLKRMVSEGRIWFGKNGDAFPRLKRYLSEVQQGRKVDTLWLSSEVGHNQESKREIKELFNGKAYFDTPKPTRLISRCLSIATEKDDIVLDFFAGSSTTAHSVMQLNAEDGGSRKFIMVQIPEILDEKSEASLDGFKSIAEISKERIKLAGLKIKKNNKDSLNISNIDIGFRVLKIDTSNMKEVFYTPDAVSQDLLSDQVNNIREGRTSEDLLFQVLLDWGVDLALPITQEKIAGKTVYFVDGNALAACFEEGVSEEFVKLLAKREPLRAVFRDAGFASDSVKINVEQIFKLMSPATDVKTI